MRAIPAELLLHECSKCGAAAGQPCRTPKGRKKSGIHPGRPFSINFVKKAYDESLHEHIQQCTDAFHTLSGISSHFTNIFNSAPTHSIHCRGYRGTGQPWDNRDCDCGATIRHLMAVIKAMDAHASEINNNMQGVLSKLKGLLNKVQT